MWYAEVLCRSRYGRAAADYFSFSGWVVCLENGMQVKDEGQKRGGMSRERTQTGGMDADRDRGEACVGFTCDRQKEYMRMLPDDLGAGERDCWHCAVQVSEKQLSSMQGAQLATHVNREMTSSNALVTLCVCHSNGDITRV